MRSTLVAGLAGLLAFGSVAVPATEALVASVKTPYVTVTFGPALSVAAPGMDVDFVVHQRIADGWHTYWENPGDSGQRIAVDWVLPEGDIGKAYGARTTPHMFVIDDDGVLRYMGGIDDRPSTRPADVEGANNYVRAALSDMKSGREVATPVARPYGCSVKYGS